VRAVLRLLVVVVQLAVGAGAVRRHVREERVPQEAHVHVIARRLRRREAYGALEPALADAGFDVVADVVNDEPGSVDGLEQVGCELLVRGERRPARRLLGTRLLRDRVAGHYCGRPARTRRSARPASNTALISTNASAIAMPSGSSTAGVEYV